MKAQRSSAAWGLMQRHWAERISSRLLPCCRLCRAGSRSSEGSFTKRLMPRAQKNSALRCSQPGMGETWINGAPQTAASVEDRPPAWK